MNMFVGSYILHLEFFEEFWVSIISDSQMKFLCQFNFFIDPDFSSKENFNNQMETLILMQ